MIMIVMVSVVWMLVSHGMSMSFMREEVCMPIQVLSIFISSHFAKYVREFSDYSGQLRYRRKGQYQWNEN